ncbi:hypothetical protein M9Y10_003159 [Tritrichomonas musculus]|uniref:Clan CA, family C1, cathepsin L-like cysteine peptidase n=1 Tax=Tritrichomonas musculus TaxID=1915356 RepID=A0ABR2JPF4_9EUKA
MLSLFFITISSKLYYTQQEEKSFLSWMRTNSQIYTGDEYHLRLGIYLTNSRLVKTHNNSKSKFKVTLNKFACLTPTEYRSLLGFRYTNDKLSRPKFASKPKSASIDWRIRGVVNPIKDQGQCGSCWAFSAIQTVESIDCISNGSLLSLSEQSLVDCCFACFGCSGGNPYLAISYIVEKQGGKFNLETDYPYTGVLGNCHFDEYKKYGSVSGYLSIATDDEDDLAEKVENNGPTSVSIDASSWSFQLYESGIYDDNKCNKEAINHSIGCVGFGVEGDTKYWIIRNSWGTSWGEEGYMRMIWENNICGIASMAVVAIP